MGRKYWAIMTDVLTSQHIGSSVSGSVSIKNGAGDHDTGNQLHAFNDNG